MSDNPINMFNMLRRPLSVGDYVKNVTIDPETGVNIYDFISNHLLLFCFSTDCKSCISTLEVVYEFMEKNRNLNMLILISTPEEDFHSIKSLFEDKVTGMFLVEKYVLTKKIGAREMPRGYCLNKLGQVLATNNSFNQYWMAKLVEPLENIVDFVTLEEKVDES